MGPAMSCSQISKALLQRQETARRTVLGKVPVPAPHPPDRQGCGSSMAKRQAGEGFGLKQSSGEVWLKSAEIMETLRDTSVHAAESKQHGQNVLGPNRNLAMPVP